MVTRYHKQTDAQYKAPAVGVEGWDAMRSVRAIN